MAAGVVLRQPGVNYNAPPPSMLNPQQEASTAAMQTQAGDYDRIMQSYQALLKEQQNNPVPQFNYTPVTPQLQQYAPSADFSGALSQLKTASETGGYDPEGLAAIRARGVSPIRSIYANAQRNMERNRSLSGGYSPNFNAASAKMAREQSEQLAAANTAIEADIADRVAKGKATSLAGFSSLASEDNRLKYNTEAANTNTVNQTNQLNASMPLDYAKTNASLLGNAQNTKLQAIQGQQSLYGTTPALTSLFGNQNLQQQQLAQNQSQFDAEQRAREEASKNQLGASILGSYRRPVFG